MVYDLMMQIIQESKSLYRIKKNYCDDAEGVNDCSEVWRELSADKEAHIDKLVGILRKHL